MHCEAEEDAVSDDWRHGRGRRFLRVYKGKLIIGIYTKYGRGFSAKQLLRTETVPIADRVRRRLAPVRNRSGLLWRRRIIKRRLGWGS